MKKILLILFICFNTTLLHSEVFDSIDEKVQYYKSQFSVECLHEKITNNFGNGYDSLYGTRNMKPVLHGVAYRGGANNYYHKSSKRDNRNPLPEDGLINLSKYGFSEAIYLYTKNFESCEKNYSANDNELIYTQNSLDNVEETKELLLKVKKIIDKPDLGPLYFHCWNGWHQSGFAASIILMQFCDYSQEKALEYWIENTDGANKGYEHIKNAIKNFKPFEDINIDKNTKELICPCLGMKE